ncbi:MAG: dUTP diphosphatase [Campylobacterota bacterium]|nr:dUTP diphosphatase [Campylobacterota bacterium]
MDKALQMIQLQQQLNDTTNGENWENGLTKNNKRIDWKRCIYMECAEMIDSFAWKHWKSINAEPDFANLQIEVVDVWHFVISLALQEYRKEFKGGVEDLAFNISQFSEYDALKADVAFATPQEIMLQVEGLMFLVLNPSEFDLEALIKAFLSLCVGSNLDLNALYRLYVGKNILNQFRQDHGYKDGSYIKVWNGVEDNLIMKAIWQEQGELKPEELYKQLELKYDVLP